MIENMIDTLTIAVVSLASAAVGSLLTIWKRFTPTEVDAIFDTIQVSVSMAGDEGYNITPEEALMIIQTAINGYLNE
jgi:hypothetical protein